MQQDHPGTIRVEITLDVICAASYVAFTRLRHVLGEVRAGGTHVDVAFRPFQLAPASDFDGRPLLDVLREMFGPQVVEETERAAAEAVRDGVVLDYRAAVAAGTFEAHRLIASAAREGLAEPMVERLFRAHFTDGLNIADPAVLARLADEVGVSSSDASVEGLRRDLALVRSRGVRSVPQISVDGGPTLVGQRSAEEYRQALGAVRAAS
ncbi:DsbA family protein [Nocardioides sp.]|uniref:DsbA family oxidoreductase n=1 Tax=Nocardioides sp. TaxID=35761 RepID=UPI002734579B|nr:DsbA family protein [Nocardioides sp.]MDP3890084.1 DsbA family protein [Nocardioides sp.]